MLTTIMRQKNIEKFRMNIWDGRSNKNYSYPDGGTKSTHISIIFDTIN